MAEKEYIDKGYVLYIVRYYAAMQTWSKRNIISEILRKIRNEKVADVVKVVHGRWEQIGEADYRCPVCGFRFTSCDPIEMFAYCRCGAKMDGGELDGK